MSLLPIFNISPCTFCASLYRAFHFIKSALIQKVSSLFNQSVSLQNIPDRPNPIKVTSINTEEISPDSIFKEECVEDVNREEVNDEIQDYIVIKAYDSSKKDAIQIRLTQFHRKISKVYSKLLKFNLTEKKERELKESMKEFDVFCKSDKFNKTFLSSHLLLNLCEEYVHTINKSYRNEITSFSDQEINIIKECRSSLSQLKNELSDVSEMISSL